MLPVIGISDRIKQIPALCFILTELGDVVMTKVKLSFSYVATMLSFGVLAVGFQLFGCKYPIANLVPPHSHPDKDITTSRLHLLEIHIKRSV